MSYTFEELTEVIETAVNMFQKDINEWCGRFPLGKRELRNIMRAGVQAGLKGGSATFYAAQWMSQVYALKPDIRLMAILQGLDHFCVTVAIPTLIREDVDDTKVIPLSSEEDEPHFEACQKTHTQACHKCDNFACADNSNPDR